MADQYVIHKYEHGGGRVFIQRDNGSRDLIIDLYERRDEILDALMVAEILPPKSKCVINEY